MSLKWPSGVESGKEATFNNERANKWTDAIIPTNSMRIHQLAGTASQRTTEALSSSILYVLVSFDNVHIVSGDLAVTASTTSLKWPALVPYFFIPLSGAQYIAARRPNAAQAVDVQIAPVENLE